MDIPSNLKILGLNIKVVEKQNLAASDDAFGYYSPINGEIALDATQDEQHKHSTLWHEVIEAINKELELGLEHRQITALGTSINQVLKDNWKM